MLFHKIIGLMVSTALTFSTISSPLQASSGNEGKVNSSDSNKKDQKKKKGKNKNVYDYVIVGAGTAGCLMAYHLSNDKKTRVLVLEEGSNLDETSEVLNQDLPAGNISSNLASFTQMAAGKRHTYYHEWFTIPMPGLNAPPVQNRPILYGGGRIAGGTSSTNSGFWVRPSPQALDTWVALTGDEEYAMGNHPENQTATAMLKRFIESETYLPQNPNEEHLYWHGYGDSGFNTIFNRQQQSTPGGSIFANLVQNFTRDILLSDSMPNVDTFPGPSPFTGAPGPAFDRNNPNYAYHTTAMVPTQTRSDATRSQSSREFLFAKNGTPPAGTNVPVVYRDAEKNVDYGIKKRKLKVKYESTVLNIGWANKKNKDGEVVAKSLTYLKDGVFHTVKIKHKLILCAGINSATILLKNGIGPADELEAAGIPVVVDNPQVGRNIQNHPILSIAIAQQPIDGVVRTVSFRSRDTANIATLTLSSVAGLSVGNYLNVSGVGGSGYNLNNVQILSIGVPTPNDVSYYNVGAPEGTTANVSTSTGATLSSRVIHVDQFRAGKNSWLSWYCKAPYGWDGLDGGITDANLERLAKWGLTGNVLGTVFSASHFNPAASGFIKVLKPDPLHPVFCDLQYLANNSDITDYIAVSRQIVNTIDYLRNVEGIHNYDIGGAPSRATIAGTPAPPVSFIQRTNNVATLTLAAAPAPALAVNGFITVTQVPDASFNAIGAVVRAVSPTTVSYSNPGPDIALTASSGTVSDQAALVTFIRNAFTQNHHFACSCQMRDTKENGGVVDPFGNVFETANVMVCDGSAFPAQIDANLAGMIFAFARKITDDLITCRNPKAIKNSCQK